MFYRINLVYEYKRKYFNLNNTLVTTTMPGLDINWFRKDKGFDPDIIKKSLERRFRKPEIVDEIIAKDNEWRKSIFFLIQSGMNLTCSINNGMLCKKFSSKRKKQTKLIPVLKNLRKRKKIKLNKQKSKNRKKFFFLDSML